VFYGNRENLKKTGKNQDFKARTQRAAAKNKK